MMLKKIALLVTLPLAFAADTCESIPTCTKAETGKCAAKYSNCKTCGKDLTASTDPKLQAVIDRNSGECSAATNAAGLADCCEACADGYVKDLTDGSGGANGVDCVKCGQWNCKTCPSLAEKAKCTTCMDGYTIKTANTCDGPCAAGYKFVKTGLTDWKCTGGGSSSSASGDPHVTNIRGEAFDVLRAGDMDVIVLPRGASPASPIHHLTVQAKIARASKQLCEATFIERVWVFGSWLGEEKELVIDAGTVHDMTPLRLKLGSDKEWTDWDKVNNVLNAENAQVPKTTITSSRDQGKHPTIKVAFDIGGEDISLQVGLFQHKHFSFLNLDVNGLENYEAEVGGILGLDSHSLATAPDVECEHKFERKHSEEGLEIVASKMTASLGLARS